MEKKALTFLPLIGYIIILLTVFASVLMLAEDKLIWGDDVHRQYYFYRQYINQTLARGELPLWNPHFFSGAPFIGNAITNFWYPATWMYVILPLQIAFSWHIFFHVLWAMCGMYLLARLLADKLPSWFAGLIFGLSGFFMSRTWAGHMDVIAAASWMPWTVWAFWQLMSSETYQVSKRLVIASGIFGLQLLAGYQTMAFFTLEAVGIIALLHILKDRSPRPIVRAFVAALFGMGIAAIQLVPVQEFFRQSIRTFDFPYSWVSAGSMTFESLWQLINPFHFGDQRSYTGPPPNYHEHAGFVGRVGLLMLNVGAVFWLLGLTRLKFRISNFELKVYSVAEKPHIKTLLLASLILVLGSLWVSLGPNAPIDLQKILWELVPMYHYLRFPPRHLILFVLSASLLAGYGLNRIRRLPIQIAIVAVGLLEMTAFASHFIHSEPAPQTRHDHKLIESLRSGSGDLSRYLTNFGVWIEPRNSLDADAAMSYGLYNATGYDPSILKSYYRFIDASLRNSSPSILTHDVQVPYMDVFGTAVDFLNVRYVIHPTFTDPIFGTQGKYKIVTENLERQYRVYENSTVLPRFYLVNQAEYLDTDEEVYARIASGFSDFHSRVLLTNPNNSAIPAIASCQRQGTVTVSSYRANHISLSVQSDCPSLLVSSEVNFPGWSATVNGTKTDILTGNLAFRVVVVPAGMSKIEMQYLPTSLLIGALISTITIILMLLLAKKNFLLHRFQEIL